jgi:hypothetical protein
LAIADWGLPIDSLRTLYFELCTLNFVLIGGRRSTEDQRTKYKVQSTKYKALPEFEIEDLRSEIQ